MKENNMESGFKFIDYGLTGKTVDIKLGAGYDPYLYRDLWIPAKTIAEYEKFILFEILPHENPNGYGMSRPYRLSIHKAKIVFGEVRIRYFKGAPIV